MDSDRPPSHAPGSQRPGPIDPLSDPQDYAEKLPPTPSYPAPSPRAPMPAVGFMNQSAGFPPPYQQFGAVPYSTAPMQAPYGQYPLGTLPPPGPYQGQQLGQVPYSNYGQRYPNPPPMGYASRPYGSRPQQQQTVYIGGSPVVYQPVVISQSFARHYALACIVFWCFGCLFGLIAYILACTSHPILSSVSLPTSSHVRLT